MVTPQSESNRPHRPTSRAAATGRTAGPVRFPPARGFSLAELLMVMAIIGTAAAIATPRFAEAASRWRVQGAADRLTADLERARATAIATSAEVIVAFETTGYQLKSASDLEPAEELGTVVLDQAPYGVEIISVDFGGESKVVFSGTGVASADGKLVLGRGDYRVAITYEALTGRAKPGAIYEDDSPKATKVEAIEDVKIIGAGK